MQLPPITHRLSFFSAPYILLSNTANTSLSLPSSDSLGENLIGSLVSFERPRALVIFSLVPFVVNPFSHPSRPRPCCERGFTLLFIAATKLRTLRKLMMRNCPTAIQ